MRKNILILCIAVFIVLTALEVILRLFYEEKVFLAGSPESPKGRIYGWAPYPNAKMYFRSPDTGELYDYRTNSQGWKDVEHSFGKRAGSIRILIIGDSHTYGIGRFEDNYPLVLEKILRDSSGKDVEVISMGAGGWGTDQEMEALFIEGFSYSPDIVILQFCQNDLVDIINPDDSTPKSSTYRFKPFKYIVKDSILVREKLEAKKLGPVYYLTKYSHLYRYVITSFTSFRAAKAKEKRDRNQNAAGYTIIDTGQYFLDFFAIGKEPKFISDIYELFQSMLERIDDECRKQGVEFLLFSEAADSSKRQFLIDHSIIIADDYGDYIISGGVKHRIDCMQSERRIRAICDSLGVSVVDHRRSYIRYKNNPHVNKEGNIHMAKDIADFLREHSAYFKKQE